MSQPRLVLATTNRGKLAELRQLLNNVLDLETVVGMDQFEVPDIVEDGISFEENSALKARAVAAATGLPVIADDSGLCVDVLGGAPGIFSARWSGTHGADEANYRLLLSQIADVKEEHRGAEFRCVATFATPDGTLETGTGIVRGRIALKPSGTQGFGYDPVFQNPLGIQAHWCYIPFRYAGVLTGASNSSSISSCRRNSVSDAPGISRLVT